jgi:hypothetical protein
MENGYGDAMTNKLTLEAIKKSLDKIREYRERKFARLKPKKTLT